MDSVLTILAALKPQSLMPIAIALMVIGASVAVYPVWAQSRGRNDMRRRLTVKAPETTVKEEENRTRKEANAVKDKALKKAQDFYAKTDPDNVARLRMRLIRAGYMDHKAVGVFFLIRFVSLAVFGVGAFAMSGISGGQATTTETVLYAIGAAALGYFVPGLLLGRQEKAKMTEYRNGFPDFMDLMIVCSDAGMSMEAGIERVSREIAVSYPTLSEHLRLLTIELRAGRNLESSLKSLSDRLGLEEVRAFATLLQQSKELGTSLAGALRVFSDEMRNKRMMKAEEKAHALPAKMTIPVTVCILPVIMLVATIPIIVKMTME